jgi:tRNA nucleotidyltransferase (CCA-adding enzyme)
MLLGIYEDTGSLTYATTTPRDIRAAASLLEAGARLAVVRRFLNVALTAKQRELFDQLERSAVWVEVAGHSVVVATASAAEGFDEEISSVAHRLRESLSAVALIVLVEIHDDVQLVARSSSSYVDVSIVARSLGGGGHDRAAAAMVVGRSLTYVSNQVMNLLQEAAQPTATVAQIMSHGVQTLAPEATVAEAAGLMKRFGYEGYPVIDDERRCLAGLVTRRAVDRATSHGLDHLPVRRIMRAGAVMVRPSDSVDRVQQLMLDEGWGQIPVFGDDEDGAELGHPIGVVTRTDVLNFIFKPPPQEAEPDMRQLLGDTLSPALWKMLLVVSETAAALQMPVYFVGGLVRDVLLQKPATDLDLVVEGDAIRLVRELQSQYGGEIHTHSRFGTGKWFVTLEVWRTVAPQVPLVECPQTIDFVSARTEFYTEPSALPEVEHGSIKLDLHRRDFTINTLAVRVDGSHLGVLLDFYGGQRDLKQGIIRVLHSLSFVDDPTRILRAIRLEQRLGFQTESRTAELMVEALPMLDRVSGSRIRHEIELALRETAPERIMQRLAELDVMSHICPGLYWDEAMAGSYARVLQLQTKRGWKELLGPESLLFVYFALWMTPLPAEVQAEALERLRVRKATREDVVAVSKLLDALCALPQDAAPSQVEKALRNFRDRTIVVARLSLEDGPPAARLEQYYSEWRQVRTAINGDDLREMGLKPGPDFAVILDSLLAARLDHEVVDESGERSLLSEILASLQT